MFVSMAISSLSKLVESLLLNFFDCGFPLPRNILAMFATLCLSACLSMR